MCVLTIRAKKISKSIYKNTPIIGCILSFFLLLRAYIVTMMNFASLLGEYNIYLILYMKLYRDRNMLILHQISCSFSRILLPISPKSNQKFLDFRDFTSKFGNFEYFFTNTLKHLYRGCYGQKIG